VSVKFQIPVHRHVTLPVAFVVLVRRLTRVLPTVTGEFVNSACTEGAGVVTVGVALKETLYVALPAALVAVIVHAVLPALPAATAGNVWS
jgi:hypothetical protein